MEDADLPEGVLQIMNFIFSKSLTKENIPQLVGISVECNRIDLLEKALRCSSDLSASLYRLLSVLQDFLYPEPVQTKLLRLVCSLFRELGDRYGMFRCLLTLLRPAGPSYLTSPLTPSGESAGRVAGGDAHVGLPDGVRPGPLWATEGLVTALLRLLPADPRVEPLRSVLLGTTSRQL